MCEFDLVTITSKEEFIRVRDGRRRPRQQHIHICILVLVESVDLVNSSVVWVDFQLELRNQSGILFKNLNTDNSSLHRKRILSISQVFKHKRDLFSTFQMNSVIACNETVGGRRGREAKLLTQILPLFRLFDELECVC